MSFFFPILCTEAVNGHVSQKALSMCIVSASANICHLKTHLNRTIFARTMVDPVASDPVYMLTCRTRKLLYKVSKFMRIKQHNCLYRCHSGERSL